MPQDATKAQAPNLPRLAGPPSPGGPTDSASLSHSKQTIFGIGLAALAFAILAAVDAMVKTLSGEYVVFQLTAMRGLIACALSLTILFWRREQSQLRSPFIKIHLLRGGLSFVAASSFFFALSQMPIADLYVIAFTAPFMVAAMSWPLLRERVAHGTWWAIGAGFIGVLIAFQPSGVTFGAAAAIGFLATFSYSISNILMRWVGPTENPLVTSIYGMGGGGALSLLVALPFWVMPNLFDAFMMLAVGLLAGLGSIALAASFRFAPAAVISPIDYSSILWGGFYGYLIFGDVPGVPTLVGATVIVAAGLWLVRQHR